METVPVANENAHPNKAGKDRKGNQGRGALAPTSSVSNNFRTGLYVDSCDAAELDLRRKPISEVNESAGEPSLHTLMSCTCSPFHSMEHACSAAPFGTSANLPAEPGRPYSRAAGWQRTRALDCKLGIVQAAKPTRSMSARC